MHGLYLKSQNGTINFGGSATYTLEFEGHAGENFFSGPYSDNGNYSSNSTGGIHGYSSGNTMWRQRLYLKGDLSDQILMVKIPVGHYFSQLQVSGSTQFAEKYVLIRSIAMEPAPLFRVYRRVAETDVLPNQGMVVRGDSGSLVFSSSQKLLAFRGVLNFPVLWPFPTNAPDLQDCDADWYCFNGSCLQIDQYNSIGIYRHSADIVAGTRLNSAAHGSWTGPVNVYANERDVRMKVVYG